MAGKSCDVCGKDDLPVIVVSSALGAISFAYCSICSPMGAEPKNIVEGTIECCNGIENIRKGLLLTYYDAETDTYIDKREGHIPIKLEDGTVFTTRTEMIEYAKQKNNE